MKKRTKCLLGATGICLLLAGGICIWQYQNLKALSEATRYSKEELAIQIDKQKEKVEETLKEYGLEETVDFTFEEEEALRKGELTLEEAVIQLEKRQEEQKKPVAPQVETEEEKNEISPKDQGQVAIQSAVSNLYLLKAEYIGKLGALERAARDEYKALSEEERKGSGAKKLMTKYMNIGLSAEKECDQKVAGILTELKQQLQKLGVSTEVIATMKASYEEEKVLKKAYYLNLLK